MILRWIQHLALPCHLIFCCVSCDISWVQFSSQISIRFLYQGGSAFDVCTIYASVVGVQSAPTFLYNYENYSRSGYLVTKTGLSLPFLLSLFTVLLGLDFIIFWHTCSLSRILAPKPEAADFLTCYYPAITVSRTRRLCYFFLYCICSSA